MKAKNRRRRLTTRQRAWEDMRSDGGDAKKKRINKQEYTKPGSLNK